MTKHIKRLTVFLLIPALLVEPETAACVFTRQHHRSTPREQFASQAMILPLTQIIPSLLPPVGKSEKHSEAMLAMSLRPPSAALRLAVSQFALSLLLGFSAYRMIMTAMEMAESDNPPTPSRVDFLTNRLFYLYLTTKSWEANGWLYERLGIKAFRRFLFKLVPLTQFPFFGYRLGGRIDNFMLRSRYLELVHISIAGSIVLELVRKAMTFGPAFWTPGSVVLVTATMSHVFLQLYLVILQRYNRAKITALDQGSQRRIQSRAAAQLQESRNQIKQNREPFKHFFKRYVMGFIVGLFAGIALVIWWFPTGPLTPLKAGIQTALEWLPFGLGFTGGAIATNRIAA